MSSIIGLLDLKENPTVKQFMDVANRSVDLFDENFPTFMNWVVAPLDCAPFADLHLVAGKDLPYTLVESGGIVGGIEARGRYFQLAWSSLAAITYHFVMAIFYSLAAAVTIGGFRSINYQVQKHWMATALTAVSVGISVIGVASPDMGLAATAGFDLLALGFLEEKINEGIYEDVKNLAQKSLREGKRDSLFVKLGSDPKFSKKNAFSMFVDVIGKEASNFFSECSCDESEEDEYAT